MEAKVEEQFPQQPVLNYKRIGQDVAAITKTDLISCVCVRLKLLVIGTSTGKVVVLSHEGKQLRTIRHAEAITSIDVDSKGEYVLSSSTDGRVVLTALSSGDTCSLTHPKSISCVAINPAFGRDNKRNDKFVVGDVSGRLIGGARNKGRIALDLHHIHHCDDPGPIRVAAICEKRVAWSNVNAVHVWDQRKQQDTCYASIVRPEDAPPGEVCPPRLMWDGPECLLVAWGDTVVVTHIPELGTTAEGQRTSSSCIWKQPMYICGLSPFGAEFLAVLGFEPSSGDSDDSGATVLPELHIISRYTGVSITADALPLHGYEEAQPIDFCMASDPLWLQGPNGLPQLFIASPQDIVQATPRGVNDHIAWCLEVGDFEAALAGVTKYRTMLPEEMYETVVDAYVSYHVQEGDLKKAARSCSQYLPNKPEVWEAWIRQFEAVFGPKGLLEIAKYVPIQTTRLKTDTYTKLLIALLDNDPVAFFHAVYCWPQLAELNSLALEEKQGAAASEARMELPDAAALADLPASFYVGPYDSRQHMLRAIHDALGKVKLRDRKLVPQNSSEKQIFSVPAVIEAAELRLGDIKAGKQDDAYIEFYLNTKGEGSKGEQREALQGQPQGEGAEAPAEGNNADESPVMGHSTIALSVLLVQSLARLYELQGSPMKAIQLCLDEGVAIDSRYLLWLVQHYDGFVLLRERLTSMLSIDAEETIDFLVNYTEQFPVDDMVALLQQAPHSMMRYLHGLYTRKPQLYLTPRFAHLHQSQISLYAHYNPQHLLPALRTMKAFVDLEKALEVCEASPSRQVLDREIAYILGELGEEEQALALLVDSVEDIPGALSFLVECKDESKRAALWESFISMAVEHPSRIIQTLKFERAAELNMESFIDRIPDALEIPNLNSLLLQLLRKCSNHRQVLRCAVRCTKEDIQSLLSTKLRKMHGAVKIETTQWQNASNKFEVKFSGMARELEPGMVPSSPRPTAHSFAKRRNTLRRSESFSSQSDSE